MTNILGSLRLDDGDGVVRMEDRYETDIDDLWTALTDPDVWRAGTARSPSARSATVGSAPSRPASRTRTRSPASPTRVRPRDD